MPHRRIHNLDSLDKEIYRLKLQAADMERRLEKKAHYLRSHWLTLGMAAILSAKKDSGSIPLRLGELLMRNEKIQETLAKLTDTLAHKLMEVVESIGSRWLHKKEKASNPPQEKADDF